MKLITRKEDNMIVQSCSIGIVTEEQDLIQLEEKSLLSPASDYNIYDISDDFSFKPYKQCYDGVNLIENENYVSPPLTQEEKLDEILNLQKTANQKYAELDLSEVTLEEVKGAKLAQLNELCNKTIVEGFSQEINGTVYHFSCSLSAQSNFTGTDALFKDGLIAESEWTVVNITTGAVERITLDQPTFNDVKLAVFQHINSNVSKFRNTLQPQVDSATTNTEVDAVTWW